MPAAILKRNLFQRVFGICATKPPCDQDCWQLENGKVILDLSRAPELDGPNGSVRLEGKSLPERMLVIRGADGAYYAFRNRCGHAGRRLDPVPEVPQVQCCSVGKAVYGYEGNKISGSGKKDLTTYAVDVEDGRLLITLP